MAQQPLSTKQNSRLKRFILWLKDRIWPTLDPLPPKHNGNADQPQLEINTKPEVVRVVYERLLAELKVEADRKRTVENKLVAAGSVSLIAVTIMVAVATSLPSGLQVLVAYAALQFLRATWATISGLSRKSYSVPTRSDLLPEGTEGLDRYLLNACNYHLRRLEQHRETTNEDVSQLALAHASIQNALFVLILAILIPLGLRFIGLVWDPTGCAWLWIWRQFA